MPNIDPKTFETDIPGLYYAGQANNSFGSLVAWGSGVVSGAAAADASKDAVPVQYDTKDVEGVLKQAYSWLEKSDSADSIRPIVIQRKIQRAYAQNLLLIKNEKGMQAALDEFLRIQREDLPKMALADKSRLMNRDWRNAMETEGMLIMSIASATAALERKESRPTHYRTDYPTNDDTNYMVFLWASLNDDGTCSVERGPIGDRYIPASDLLPQIMPIDISIPNPS
jgi:succinate dehydrogenase / fumarate reductase flavoprotein subunit